MSFYNIILPTRRSFQQFYQSDSDRVELIERLFLSKWTEYCERNWLNDYNGVKNSPEKGVKIFLDSCAYFLLLGDTEGIVTPYKDIFNDKREIPISSCPSSLSSELFGIGMGPFSTAQDTSEWDEFESMTERLDKRAAKKTSNPPPVVKKAETPRITKINREKRGPVIACRVDTNGAFVFNGKTKYIDSSVKAYAPEKTPLGLYYAMDTIYVFTENGKEPRYFDQGINLIPQNMIREVLS